MFKFLSPSKSTHTPAQNASFSDFKLSDRLQKSLQEASFEKPTPVQSAAIPLGLAGNDLIACAQTGTGKTAAFLLPLISSLESVPHETALIMAPTREIVNQIADAARIFLKNHPELKVVSIIGGARMARQIDNLKKNPRLIVGTPGRLNDLIKRGKVKLSNCRFLVFDEADRMLDMGFAPQIDEILKYVPPVRQTLMFSATMAPPVEKLAKSYLKNPQFISVGPQERAPDKLKQKVVITTLENKEDTLRNELISRQGSILVFAQTQRRVEKLGYKLKTYGFEAETLHGGRSQGQRFRALKNFRDGEVNILVATDVASRGLDIGSISHVINYDLPGNPEDFLHRVGRTARNGKDGEALTLLLQADFREFQRIKKYVGDCELVGEFTKGAQDSSRADGSRHRRKRPFSKKFSQKAKPWERGHKSHKKKQAPSHFRN